MQRHAVTWAMERELLYRMDEFERPVNLGTIAAASGLSPNEAGAALADFERWGWVARVGSDWHLTRKGLAEIRP